MCPRRKHLQNVLATLGENLDFARRPVANPSFQTQTVRLIHGGVAKSDSLNAAANYHTKLLQRRLQASALSQQIKQALFIEHADAKFLSFAQLRAGLFSRNDEVGFAAD